jgi:16S rRNA (adenine1518-N6/adenine1519-N6)-dimethyltransferase
MRIINPSELLQFLKDEKLGALKGLSQNFLIDANIVKKILSAASVEKGDEIIEIGPGPGALTQALLEKGAKVRAIELDRKFAELLERLQTEDNRLMIFKADALKVELAKILDETDRAKLVSNLPYHLTTPLLTRFLPLYPKIQSITVMVQKEVAKRIAAAPGNKQSSSLSLYVRLFSDPRYCFDVNPSCFYPKPKVTSAVIHFALHPLLKGIDPAKFEKLLRTCFLKRRKMLRSSLKDTCDKKTLESISIDPKARPEELTMDQFLALYKILFN